MDPILATGALSLAGNVVRNIASNIAAKRAQTEAAGKVNFAELLRHAEKSPALARAQLLASHGIASTEDVRRKLEADVTQIMQSPDIQGFTSGLSGEFSVQLEKTGGITVTAADGRQRTFSVDGQAGRVLSEMREITEAVSGPQGAGHKAQGPFLIKFAPGIGVTGFGQS